MVSRNELTNDFIATYLTYVKDTEPPTIFHKWVSIFLLSAAASRRHIFMYGNSRVYPNFFITLLAPAGKARKTTAVNIGKSLLSAAGVPLGADSATREGLVDSFYAAQTDVTVDTVTEFISPLALMSSEFTALLKYRDLGLLTAFLDWFDCADRWSSRTRYKEGSVELKGLYITMLGASTPSTLASALPEESAGSGIRSRMIVVYADNAEKASPFATMEESLKPKMIKKLEEVYNASGYVYYIPDDEFIEKYTMWYLDLFRKSASMHNAMLSEYYSRKQMHLVKLATISAMSRTSGKGLAKGMVDVTAFDFDWALQEMEEVEVPMRRYLFETESVDNNYFGQLKREITLVALRTEIFTKVVLLQRCQNYVRGKNDLDTALMQLVEARIIIPVPNPNGGVIRYTLNPLNPLDLKPSFERKITKALA